MIKLLLDENIPKRICDELRIRKEFDVLHINEYSKGITDDEVFELAKAQERIIITGDNDFKNKKFKYNVPIIWLTPKAKIDSNVVDKIVWIVENYKKKEINLETAFISIDMIQYNIEYKKNSKVFSKIKILKILFKNIKELNELVMLKLK